MMIKTTNLQTHYTLVSNSMPPTSLCSSCQSIGSHVFVLSLMFESCFKFPIYSLFAHSKNELMQWRGVRRLSVCLSVRPSVNFCANRFFSQTNGWIATKLSQDRLQISVHPGVLKVKVKVKGHVIRALSWILGMSYSVIDGLVFKIWTSHMSTTVIASSLQRPLFNSCCSTFLDTVLRYRPLVPE